MPPHPTASVMLGRGSGTGCPRSAVPCTRVPCATPGDGQGLGTGHPPCCDANMSPPCRRKIQISSPTSQARSWASSTGTHSFSPPPLPHITAAEWGETAPGCCQHPCLCCNGMEPCRSPWPVPGGARAAGAGGWEPLSKDSCCHGHETHSSLKIRGHKHVAAAEGGRRAGRTLPGWGARRRGRAGCAF